jgi:hypothetical protein
MILSVTYDKTSGEITVSSDVSGITAEVNANATQDESDMLSFEVAIDTSIYEASEMEIENIETTEE